MTSLYLSGGIAGIPNFAERFEMWTALLENSDYEVTNPVLVQPCADNKCLSKGVDVGTGHTWECYLRFDLIEMLTCDGIALMPGFERSRGARLELYVAGQVNLTVGTCAEWMNKLVSA